MTFLPTNPSIITTESSRALNQLPMPASKPFPQTAQAKDPKLSPPPSLYRILFIHSCNKETLIDNKFIKCSRIHLCKSRLYSDKFSKILDHEDLSSSHCSSSRIPNIVHTIRVSISKVISNKPPFICSYNNKFPIFHDPAERS
jgi:hypothetical protein